MRSLIHSITPTQSVLDTAPALCLDWSPPRAAHNTWSTNMGIQEDLKAFEEDYATAIQTILRLADDFPGALEEAYEIWKAEQEHEQ
jgi:hypothetical protein